MVTLVAFETLAVITILPEISDDLGGIAWYGWVSTAFFLGTMVGIVFAGEQADRHGAGRPYVIGLVLFVDRPGRWWPGAIDAGPRRADASSKGSAPESFRRSPTWRSGGCTASRSGRGCSPCSRRRGSFPGLIGPALAERVASVVGWRWVFLGLLPFVAIAGSLIVPELMRLTALGSEYQRPERFLRRRLVEAARVAAGAALVVAGFTASRWLLVPALVGGAVLGVGPLRRLTPPGHACAALPDCRRWCCHGGC